MIIPSLPELALASVGTFILLAGPIIFFLVAGNSSFVKNYVEKLMDEDLKSGRFDWKLRENGHLPAEEDDKNKKSDKGDSKKDKKKK